MQLNNGFKVIINEKVLNEFKEFQNTSDFMVESGGILVGYFQHMKSTFVITDITWPMMKDVQGKYRFKRRDGGHQKTMDKLWQESGFKKSYLGEWHTHNESVPKPSFVDIANWKKINSRKNNYEVNLFIILGRESLKIWYVYGNDVNEFRSGE